ncbi:MAG: aminotransferase class V-fold PLP-dependent enzyme [Proteobacteria bacterium]|nr:aminotransferase class V-fold PLP-dependent enzyme [Pseudomonadota bacterium]
MQERRPIYMDYAATTPVDPRVVETMLEFLGREGRFANPSSTAHLPGREARDAVERARVDVAATLNVAPETVLFTSGATEADNLGIKGAARSNAKRGRHIVTEKTAHKAVLDSCRALEREGFEVSYLVPDEHGIISSDALANALREDTTLVALLHANNETGVVQDLDSLARVVRQSTALFHVDAAQTAGKLRLDLGALDVDLLAFSAHKLFGPKGAGVLYLRKGVRIEPQQHGGGHERGLRAGTLATHQIAGLARAVALAAAERDVEMPRLAGLRERLWQGLAAARDVLLNGHPTRRLPNILNVSVAGVDGEALQFALRDIACSAGAACNSASREPSYVLRALGRDDRLAGASLRFSLGRWSTEDEVDCVVQRFRHEVARLRALAGTAA